MQENGQATVISYTPENDFFKGKVLEMEVCLADKPINL
jgi:hypothetical protein